MRTTKLLPIALFALAVAASGAYAEWQPLGTYRVTAYSACVICCKKADGITADGTYAPGCPDRVVAAPKELPFGARLWIEGVGPVVVHDRGKAMHGQRLDLFFHKYKDAVDWGVQHRAVYLWTEKGS